MRNVIPSLLLALLTTACATGATPPSVVAGSDPRIVDNGEGGLAVHTRDDNSGVARPVNADLARVREAIPEVLQELGVPEVGTDPARLTFGNGNITVQRLAGEQTTSWVRCGADWGAGPTTARRYRTNLSVLVSLREEGGRTWVTPVVSGSATTLGGASTAAVSCISNGRLENRIASALTARLAATAQ